MHKNSGFTLLEIIISTIILSLLLLGMLGVFVAGNTWVGHFRERMVSVELGKFFLDPLQDQVRQDTWAGSQLANPGSYNGISQTINNRVFNEIHTVSPTIAGTDLHRVTSTISWTEPAS